MSAEHITAEVAAAYGTTPRVLRSKVRTHKLAPARIELAERLSRERSMSSGEIARWMGGRNGSTIRGYLDPVRRASQLAKIRRYAAEVRK